MDFDEEILARVKGLDPAADRLRVGLAAVIGRPDGTTVKIFPNGSEEILSRPRASLEPGPPVSVCSRPKRVD